jgi:hypothetical protein
MKTLKLFIAGLLLFFACSTQAQLSVRVNIGTPPQWGPSGYTDVQYYYLPDVEAYYDVPSSMFIYYNGMTWVHRRSLPTRYRNYDLYNGYKVVMSDYHGRTPYTHFREHKQQYARGYRGQEQHNIGQRPERENYNERNYSRSRSDHRFSKGNNGGNGRGSEKYKRNGHDHENGRGNDH